MAKNYCPECGEPLAAGARFCENCGHKLEKIEESGLVVATDAAMDETEEKPRDLSAEADSFLEMRSSHHRISKPRDLSAEADSFLAEEQRLGAQDSRRAAGYTTYENGNGFPESGIKQQFFTSKGRLNRLRYFKRSFLVHLICNVAVFLIGGGNKDPNFLGILISFVASISGMMLSIRRLHDLNRSGWWILSGVALIAIYGVLVALMPYGIIFHTLGVIIAVILICIYFYLWPGTKGPNDYGPDPLA